MAFDMAAGPIAGIFTTYLGYVYDPVSHKVNAQDSWLRSALILTCFFCLSAVFCFVWWRTHAVALEWGTVNEYFLST